MEYTKFFGFREAPFNLLPNPRFFFSGASHDRALSYLTFGLNKAQGFVVLTGTIGAGKTTITDLLLQRLASSRVRAAKITATQFEADEFLRVVAHAFRLETEGRDKASIYHALQAFLRDSLEAGHRSLLFIDEAQGLRHSALEELRMLSNLQYLDQSLVQIFLVGQPELRHLLARPDLAPLRQRIVTGYHLTALREEEVKAYVIHRLRVAGWLGIPRFADDSFPLICRETEGVPRRINKLCDRVLWFAYLEELYEISRDDVASVIEDTKTEDFGILADPFDSWSEGQHSLSSDHLMRAEEKESVRGSSIIGSHGDFGHLTTAREPDPWSSETEEHPPDDSLEDSLERKVSSTDDPMRAEEKEPKPGSCIIGSHSDFGRWNATREFEPWSGKTAEDPADGSLEDSLERDVLSSADAPMRAEERMPEPGSSIISSHSDLGHLNTTQEPEPRSGKSENDLADYPEPVVRERPQANERSGAHETDRTFATPDPQSDAGGGIVLHGTGDCRIEVRGKSGVLVLSRLLRAGESYEMPTGEDLTLFADDADRLELHVDGRKVGALGGDGGVLRNVALHPESLIQAAADAVGETTTSTSRLPTLVTPAGKPTLPGEESPVETGEIASTARRTADKAATSRLTLGTTPERAGDAARREATDRNAKPAAIARTTVVPADEHPLTEDPKGQPHVALKACFGVSTEQAFAGKEPQETLPPTRQMLRLLRVSALVALVVFGVGSWYIYSKVLAAAQAAAGSEAGANTTDLSTPAAAAKMIVLPGESAPAEAGEDAQTSAPDADKLSTSQVALRTTPERSAVARTAELAILLRPGVGDDTLRKDMVILGQKTPQDLKERYARLDLDGWFTRTIDVPTSGDPFRAVVKRAVNEAKAVRQGLPVTEICAEIATANPEYGNPAARLYCTEGQGCRRASIEDQGRVEVCEAEGPDSFSSSEMRDAGLTPTSTRLVWRIPSLETLRERDRKGLLGGIGFTEFEIESSHPLDSDADAFSYEVFVNDIPVRVDGMLPELLTEPLPSDDPLKVQFGLQNLSFSGADGGCDQIAVEINLLFEGEPLEPAFRLQRRYAALRPASPVQVVSQAERFEWSGRYIKPEQAFDRVLVVGSVRVRNAEGDVTSILDHSAVVRTAAQLNEWKEKIDQSNLTYQGQRVVGVIRPPSENALFVLALGIVEPTQQVRFTFDDETAESFHAAMMEVRALQTALRPLLAADSFIQGITLGHGREASFCDS